MDTITQGNTSDITATLADVQAEMAMIRRELSTIRELLQNRLSVKPPPGNNLDRFVGMWSDFTPEEEAIFKQIAEERSRYFTVDPLDFNDENASQHP